MRGDGGEVVSAAGPRLLHPDLGRRRRGGHQPQPPAGRNPDQVLRRPGVRPDGGQVSWDWSGWSRVAQIKKVIVLMAYFLLSDH